ncbi:MAG: Hsp33 family molecular chaperone HslO [Clostridiales bacterium]|nr:Hsp33 family molecular chaperone HslO [Clostridiales bacterium]
MRDYLISATAFDGTIDVVTVDTTNISKTAIEYHNLSKTSGVLLSKTMTASLLMSNFMKNSNETLTLEINSSGESGKIVSVVNSNLEVRGYIDNTCVKLEDKETLEDKVGLDGYIKVIRDMGLKKPYIGISKTATGDIAKDLMYYYSVSEQLPSYIVLSNIKDNEGLKRSAGMLIQVMPDVNSSTIKYLQDNMERLSLFNKSLKEGNNLRDIIVYMFKEGELNFKEKRECEYKCNCSREKMKDGLMSLGKKEIEDIIKDSGEAVLECHFCNKKYKFSEQELKDMLS